MADRSKSVCRRTSLGRPETSQRFRWLAVTTCLVLLTLLTTVTHPPTAFGQDSMVVMEEGPMVMETGYPSCGTCQPYVPLHFDVRADYLAWWTKTQSIPPMVTTSPLGTSREEAGILGHPDTTILFGGDSLDQDPYSGIRFGVTAWVNACRNLGVEFNYAYIDSGDSSFAASGAGNKILAVPFVNADGFVQDSELISYPGEVDGSVSVNGSTSFETAEVLMRRVCLFQCDRRVDYLVGYRYGRLKDDLRMTEALVSRGQSGGIIPGTTFDLNDAFESENTFNGAEIGLIATQDLGCWDIEFLAKFALGTTRSKVRINGSTTIGVPGEATETDPGALFALPSNIGEHTLSKTGGMTEIGVRLNYDFAPCWRASLGYTCIYWYHLARAGDQIDTTLDLSQLPPGQLTDQTRPDVPWITEGFWAQGLNVGLECRF
jgi:hypothetical protein